MKVLGRTEFNPPLEIKDGESVELTVKIKDIDSELVCPYGICDGSGVYEEWYAVDDVKEKKCLCKTDSDMDDDS